MRMCGAQPETSGIISSTTRFLDCRSENFALGAYEALASPGSTLSLLLTSLLTLLVAIIGYNLMLGRALSLRDGVLTMVKVGIVLALTTSWPAYQVLVYDVAIKGPAEVAAEVGRSSGLPGADGTLHQRLDFADAAFVELSVLGAGPVAVETQETGGRPVAPPASAEFNALAFGGARVIFLTASIGSLATISIVTGLMLALGPFFIAFLLFDNCRSLFEGWVRVLVGMMIGAVAVSFVLGLQLAILEPWLSDALARRIAGQSLPSLPAELITVTLLFAILLMVVLLASIRLSVAFRLARVINAARHYSGNVSSSRGDAGLPAAAAAAAEPPIRSRHAVIASQVAMQQQREMAAGHDGTARRVALAAAVENGRGLLPTASNESRGLGVSRPGSRRRAQERISASVGHRDAR